MRRLVSLVLVFVIGLAAACDPGQAVTFQNDSPTLVTVYEDGLIAGTLKSGETKVFSFGEYSGNKLFEGRTQDGILILTERLT
jgi:hypothetical protein